MSDGLPDEYGVKVNKAGEIMEYFAGNNIQIGGDVKFGGSTDVTKAAGNILAQLKGTELTEEETKLKRLVEQAMLEIDGYQRMTEPQKMQEVVDFVESKYTNPPPGTNFTEKITKLINSNDIKLGGRRRRSYKNKKGSKRKGGKRNSRSKRSRSMKKRA